LIGVSTIYYLWWRWMVPVVTLPAEAAS